MGSITLFYFRNDFTNEVQKEDSDIVIDYLCSATSSGGAINSLNCGGARDAIGIVDCVHTHDPALYFHQSGTIHHIEPNSPDLLDAMRKNPEGFRRNIKYMKEKVNELEKQLKKIR